MGALDPLKETGYRISSWTERNIPDAWIIALILVLISYVMSLIWGNVDPFTSALNFGRGFFSAGILSFAMHMVWIMWTGYVIAVSPPVTRLLERLGRLPNVDKPWQTILLIALFSMITGWLHWGFSLIGSAMLVVYLARNQPKVHYPLMVITAYSGLGFVWHGGFSASAPLLVATPGHLFEKVPAAKPMGVITTDRTLFSSWNITMLIVTIVVMSLIAVALHPRPDKVKAVSPERLEALKRWIPPPKPSQPQPFAIKMDWTPIWTVMAAAFAYTWVGWWLVTQRTLTLEVVNFAFMATGALLHWYPRRFLEATRDAIKATWGIILQFPFYGGILGIFQFSALSKVFADWFVAVSTPQTYPLFAYWYAGVINYFVPSGGSEWIIVAPYLLEAANRLGVSYATITIAYAWGDMMTDIIQPFWAIPLMTIAAVEFREIAGYAFVMFLFYIVLVSIGVLLIPLNL
ncbi:MAG: TIGR00366 family protein [Candidatus Caldarchaeales archaeon]